MGSKRKAGDCNLNSSSELDESSDGRKKSVWQTFRIHSSGFTTESNRAERKKDFTKIPLDVTTSESEIRAMLIRELPQLSGKSFRFFTKDITGKWYFCPCTLQCKGNDHLEESWNGTNIARAAKSNRTVYILIESTTMEETKSGGVQNGTPTNPVSSHPQFRGSDKQNSSTPLNNKEVRAVVKVKDHQSVSCPNLSLSGLEHQGNTLVPPLSGKHENDLNQWPTQLTQLSQEQTIPETEYEKVKGSGGLTKKKEGKGEERKDKGDEEMKTDMWNNDVASTSENVFPQMHFESGYDTFSSENTALVPVDPANSVEDESTTMEETKSGGVQNGTPTNPVSSHPQFRGSVKQKSSIPLNNEEVRVVVKDHQSVSCPNLALNGLEHQGNTLVPPLSGKHENDLNQWPTQVTQLPQEQQQTIPETEYEKVKGSGGVTKEKEEEGEERKDKGDEEMKTDMWNNDVASTSGNFFPQMYFESGYDTFSSENNALVPVDPANSVEDEELQNFHLIGSPPNTNLNLISSLSTPTEFMEIYQDFPRTPLEIKEIVPNRGNVAGGETFYLSLTDAYPIHDFQVRFGPSTIPVERCGDKDFKGKVPSSSKAGVEQVYLVNGWLGAMSNSKPFEYIDPNKAKEDFVEKDVNNSEDFEAMLLLLSRKVRKMNLNSNETKDSKGTNQPGGGKTQALSLLYMIANTAAMLNAIEFYKIIFSTQVGHSVFKSCKDAQMPLEEIARENGHEELARLLEEKHLMYQDDENESDDEVDWKELATAIEKYQTLKGETAEKKSVPSTSSSEQIQGYLGDGESSTSLSSFNLLDVEGSLESMFEDEQTTPESMCGEETDNCQITAAEGCPESTFHEQQTTPESRCEEEPNTRQTTVAEGCPENTLKEQQILPKSRCEEKPYTCQTTGRIARGLNQDEMSETDTINAISSFDKLRMDKAPKMKDSQSSIGEKRSLANLHLNPIYFGGGDPIIGKTFKMDEFAPKEVSSLSRKLGSFDAGKTNTSSFYPDRDQVIYNLVKRLDTFPEFDSLEETKQDLTGSLKAQEGTKNSGTAKIELNVTKRKGATVIKNESITCLYSPLHCVEVESGLEIATLAGNTPNTSLEQSSGEEELSQDAGFQNENASVKVCLTLWRRGRFALAFLLISLVIVGICVPTYIFLLPGRRVQHTADKGWIVQHTADKAGSKKQKPTTAVETMTTSRQACSNGLLTLFCESVTDVNAVHNVQWKIKFPDAGWNEFAYCERSSLNCVVTRPVLPEGIKVLKVSNRSVNLQRIARDNTNGYAQILCQVLYSNNSLTSHVYKINFTAKCVWIQERHNLNLTKILQSIVPCERVVDIEWYSINGSKFAYCNPCQECKKISVINRDQVFWNRLEVTRGSLLLTAIQENDNGRTIRVKVHIKAIGSYTTREVEANTESVHMYTIWIFVNTTRPPAFSNTTNAQWKMKINEKATVPCPIFQEVVKEDDTFDIVYWSVRKSNSCDRTWDWIAGMNQERKAEVARNGINITSQGALEIQKVQLSDVGIYKCTVKRGGNRSKRRYFATLIVDGVVPEKENKSLCVSPVKVPNFDSGVNFPCKEQQIHWDTAVGKRPKCFDCPDCLSGTEPSVPCGTSVNYWPDIHCVSCELGKTYSDRNDRSQCKACAVCSIGKAVKSSCTLTTNTICDSKCRPGFYTDRLTFDCLPCTQCCGDGKDKFAAECAKDNNKCKVKSTPCTPKTSKRNYSTYTLPTIQTADKSKFTNAIFVVPVLVLCCSIPFLGLLVFKKRHRLVLLMSRCLIPHSSASYQSSQESAAYLPSRSKSTQPDGSVTPQHMESTPLQTNGAVSSQPNESESPRSSSSSFPV